MQIFLIREKKLAEESFGEGLIFPRSLIATNGGNDAELKRPLPRFRGGR